MSYNLNPTDKVIQAAKDVYNAADGINAKADGAFIKVTWNDFAILMLFINDMSEALTAYEKSKEEQQSEKVPIHKCEYCGAMTEQPDEVCWNNPDRQPTQEPESKDGKMDFDLEIEGTAEILMGSDSLPANVIILSGLVNRATKDLTDEVERLKAENEHLRNRPRVNNGPFD